MVAGGAQGRAATIVAGNGKLIRAPPSLLLGRTQFSGFGVFVVETFVAAFANASLVNPRRSNAAPACAIVSFRFCRSDCFSNSVRFLERGRAGAFVGGEGAGLDGTVVVGEVGGAASNPAFRASAALTFR